MKQQFYCTLFVLTTTTTQLLAAVPPSQKQQAQGGQTLEEIREIKDIIVTPGIHPGWYWLGGAALLLLLFIVTLAYINKRRRKAQQSISARDKANRALKNVRSLMTPEQSKAFAIRMVDILRQYIEDQFHLSTQHVTTREFFESLINSPDPIPSELNRHKTTLQEWLNHCDMVKFARYPLTTQEIDTMYHAVQRFIEDTYSLEGTNGLDKMSAEIPKQEESVHE